VRTPSSPIDDRARGYREEFDRSFQRVLEPARTESENLLALRTGAERWAFRMVDIASVHARCRIVPVPSSSSALLGLAGLRNAIVPIYDLGSLLGQPAEAPPGWVVLIRARQPVGLAFEHFEGQLRLPREHVIAASDGSQARGPVRGVIDSGDVRSVLDVSSLLQTIAGWERAPDRHREG